ncbi:MAG: deoxyuridine 5'-triphosphate nucleotidohydrolase [Firmicutes bacterium]|nr:deoxyuridine 5'-triphosphate nucleotidohydrolase [Bacillota bacterium]MDY5531294.1 deoxyuridine 5'-triphosphate nucleotidohydrolase [Pumilibacteraceae bacterium]
MNKFEKISLNRFLLDMSGKCEYDDVKLPRRATKNSAGYDFFSPFDFSLTAGESVKVPTGIRVLLDDDKVLLIAPRSGLGFKFRLQLDNTLGVVDADYSGSDNEGHIFIKITNDSKENKTLSVKKGEAFAQGIIVQFFKTIDDDATAERNGGFGSTNNK